MDSLSKKIQNLGIHDFRNAGRFVQNMIVQYEPYQIDIRRATNTDAWGPTPKHLQKVMRHRYTVPLYLMTEYTLKRLIDHIAQSPKNLYEKARKDYVNYGSEWRVVMKCLLIIEFLLMNVSNGDELNQVKNCLIKHKHILSKETINYKIPFSNDGKMEVHERGIHKKCELVLQYLDDGNFLERERKANQKNSLKIQKQGEAVIYNANSTDENVDVEDDDGDGELQARVNYEHRMHTSQNVDEQRRQRREILKERIKNNEEQRRKASQPVPDLLDFDDFPEPQPDVPTTEASKISQGEQLEEEEDFGDFQSDSNNTNSTPLTNNDLFDSLSIPVTQPTSIASELARKADVFADLFTNSKSLI